MPAIFISYRREDSSGYSGRLYDLLTLEFGKGQVFMDIDSIDPGADFLEVIEKTVAASDAVLVVIGRQWLSVVDAQGRRRLENPADFVRLEVETALSRKVRVVPVLVGGAQMPRPDELPETLGDLLRRHALDLPDAAFHQTLGRLIDSLRKNEAKAREQPEQEPLAGGVKAREQTEQEPIAPQTEAREPIERGRLAREAIPERAEKETQTGSNETIVPEPIAQRSSLPKPDSVQEACADYQIAPATADDVVWAAGLATKVYSGFDVIPPEVMLEWFNSNPNGFSIFRCSGSRAGNLDILPVKPNTLSRMVAGSLLERDVTGDCLYTPADRHLIDALYIESLVVDPSFPAAGPRIVVEILLNFKAMIERICDTERVQRIYAIAASDEGTGLLTRLGFESVGTADGRRDAHQLFLGSMESVTRSIQQLIGRKLESRSPEDASVDDRSPDSGPNQHARPSVAPSDEVLGLNPELACVLFTDIVGFTKLDPSAQLFARQTLERVVGDSSSFSQAKRGGFVIVRPTGEGVAIIFFAHPSVAAKCAAEIARMLRLISGVAVRMGINQGTIYRRKDINGNADASGSGINMAQGVMDAGDAGHILMSASVAEALRGTVEWYQNIQSIGRRRIKHGDIVEMFSLCGADFGNAAAPSSKSLRNWRRLSTKS